MMNFQARLLMCVGRNHTEVEFEEIVIEIPKGRTSVIEVALKCVALSQLCTPHCKL